MMRLRAVALSTGLARVRSLSSATQSQASAKVFVDKFQSDGFCFGLPVLSEKDLQKVRSCLAKVEAEQPGGRLPPQMLNLHLKHPEIWDFVRSPAMLEAAAAISGRPSSELRPMATTVITKYPTPKGEEAKGTVGWHQDVQYWSLSPQEAFSTWVAIDKVTEENGAMWMAPGMHRSGPFEHVLQGEDADSILMNKQAIPDEIVGKVDHICVELNPGEMSIHDGWTPHMSAPNRSNRRRMGIVVNWITCDVHVGPSQYDLSKDPEWRLPVDLSDEFPPQVLQSMCSANCT